MSTGSAALRRHAHRVVYQLSTVPRGGPVRQHREMAAATAPLIAAHRRIFPRADIEPLLRAYEMAERYHRGQVRKSGTPYITHPLAVAELLAAIGMDTTTLAA